MMQNMEQKGGQLVLVTEPEPLYQYSYPGQPGYAPERCSDCYDKMMQRREEKKAKIIAK
jgi:hypothetical protein